MRLFYNIDTDKIYIFDQSHVQFYHNNKGKLGIIFDASIRGIIREGILYLRVFYPYNDIDTLDYNTLLFKSESLLRLYRDKILLALNKEGIKILDVKYNLTNDNLKDILKTNYV
jgi:hypothetical protein